MKAAHRSAAEVSSPSTQGDQDQSVVRRILRIEGRDTAQGVLKYLQSVAV